MHRWKCEVFVHDPKFQVPSMHYQLKFGDISVAQNLNQMHELLVVVQQCIHSLKF